MCRPLRFQNLLGLVLLFLLMTSVSLGQEKDEDFHNDETGRGGEYQDHATDDDDDDGGNVNGKFTRFFYCPFETMYSVPARFRILMLRVVEKVQIWLLIIFSTIYSLMPATTSYLYKIDTSTWAQRLINLEIPVLIQSPK